MNKVKHITDEAERQRVFDRIQEIVVYEQPVIPLFNAENMAGASILPLITAPVIANMKLHHVLIDGGAALNVISHAAFKQLQIPGS